ncbi:MAG: DUF4262 domain-containing protein [Microthrixaceae bacterium]
MEIEGIIELFRTEILAGSFNVAALLADETGCDWAYSVGLARNFQHPELILTGIDATIAGALIEVIGQQVSRGRVLQVGDTVQIAGCMDLVVRELEGAWLARSDLFELGRAVMSSLDECWPSTLQLVQPQAQSEFPRVPGELGRTLHQPLVTLN